MQCTNQNIYKLTIFKCILQYAYLMKCVKQFLSLLPPWYVAVLYPFQYSAILPPGRVQETISWPPILSPVSHSLTGSSPPDVLSSLWDPVTTHHGIHYPLSRWQSLNSDQDLCTNCLRFFYSLISRSFIFEKNHKQEDWFKPANRAREAQWKPALEITTIQIKIENEKESKLRGGSVHVYSTLFSFPTAPLWSLSKH